MTMPSISGIQEDLKEKIYDIVPGTTQGSLKFISDNENKEVTVTGLGDSGDDKLYFVDNSNDKNVTAYVDGTGIHSQEFRIPKGSVDGGDILLSNVHKDVVAV